MSYANQFRKEVGKNWSGTPRYEQGSFWSPRPINKGTTVLVRSATFETGMYVEVLQSVASKKTAVDFNFSEILVGHVG